MKFSCILLVLFSSCIINGRVTNNNPQIDTYLLKINKYKVDKIIENIISIDTALTFDYIEEYKYTEFFNKAFTITTIVPKIGKVQYAFFFYDTHLGWIDADTTELNLSFIRYNCKLYDVRSYKNLNDTISAAIMNHISTNFINKIYESIELYTDLNIKIDSYFYAEYPKKIYFVSTNSKGSIIYFDSLFYDRPSLDNLKNWQKLDPCDY